MRIDNPELFAYGDAGGVRRAPDGAYVFDGAAGSAGLSLRFPEGWNGFERVVFFVEAENSRPADGSMALIVNDGYCAWGPPVAKGPYPWIDPGASSLAYPVSVFAGGAASFQLNETFGHSTNWKIRVTRVEFQNVEKKPLFVDAPDFAVHGHTENKTRNPDGSYTFVGDLSTLLCFRFPDGWKGFENVSFFIDDARNHVENATMSLIVKAGYNSWEEIDKASYDRYPKISPGSNVLTYPTGAFGDGAGFQLNKFGHSTNWTMRVTKIAFHDGSISDAFLD